MRALADRRDRRLGGADEPHDLAVLELRMIAHQPQDGVGTVLAARNRRIARALFALGLGQAHFRLRQLQLGVGIGLGLLDLLAGELGGEDRIEALDALRSVAVGDRFHLQRVQVAELGDLVERQSGVLNEPDRGSLGHQRCNSHNEISSALRPPPDRKRSLVPSTMTGKWPEYKLSTPSCAMAKIAAS